MFINFFHYREHIGVPRKLSVCVLCIRTGRGGTKLATTFYPLPPPLPAIQSWAEGRNLPELQRFSGGKLSFVHLSNLETIPTLVKYLIWVSKLNVTLLFLFLLFLLLLLFFSIPLLFFLDPSLLHRRPYFPPRYVFNEAGVISTTDLLQTRVSLTRFPFVYSVIVRFLYIHEYE